MSSSTARSTAVALLQRGELAAISIRDVRFGRLIRGLDRTARFLRDALASILESPEVDHEHEARLAQLARELEAAQRMSLEDELEAIAAGGVKQPSGVLRYLGWDGLGGSTLQVAGDESGISRERVRQLAEKMKRKVGPETFAPALERAIDILEISTSAEVLEEALLRAEITARLFRIEGVLSAATILRARDSQTVAFVGRGRFLLTGEEARVVQLIQDVAQRTVNRWGVATMAEVEDRVLEEVGTDVPLELVAVVESVRGFKWLDRESGWFWIEGDSGRNRLLNQMRKILCVSPRIHVGELRAGIGRHYRMQGFAPPKRVLIALAAAHSSYRVEGELVIADPPPDWREVLANTEETLVDVLRERGSVARREELEEACIARGINRNTFYVYLSYSPIISRYGPGIYGLRGADIQPGLVESMRIRKPRGRLLQDYGWTPHGGVWLGYQVNESTVASGVVSIPSSLNDFVTGEFLITDSQGLRLGRLGTRGSRAWGLQPLIRRRGLEPGDYLSLTLDLGSRVAVADWGSEPPWEEADPDGAILPTDLRQILGVNPPRDSRPVS